MAENKPDTKVRVGGVTATVWKNVVKKDGKEYTNFSVDLQRSYKDKDDKWQNTNSLRTNDLPKAILALQKVFEYLVLAEKEE